MNFSTLKKALQNSWSKETSYCPNEWNESNPSIGQCATTALIVNDYLGGEIVWAEVILPDGKKISHFFNLVDGEEIDFTKEQFPEGTVIPPGIKKNKNFPTTRDFILSHEEQVGRYKMLKEKVDKFLEANINY